MLPPATQDTLAALQRDDHAGARELRLPDLVAFLRDVLALADTLEVLDLSQGTLTELSHHLNRLRRPRVLFCSGNRFTRLPSVLGDCPTLTHHVGQAHPGPRVCPRAIKNDASHRSSSPRQSNPMAGPPSSRPPMNRQSDANAIPPELILPK